MRTWFKFNQINNKYKYCLFCKIRLPWKCSHLSEYKSSISSLLFKVQIFRLWIQSQQCLFKVQIFRLCDPICLKFQQNMILYSLKSESRLWIQFNLIPVHTCLCESGKEKKSANSLMLHVLSSYLYTYLKDKIK